MNFPTFHPHPIDDRAYWDAARQNPRHADFWARIETLALQVPDSPPLLKASDFLAASRRNERSVTDRFWREMRSNLAVLALRRCTLGLEDADPDDRLLDWLWAALSASSWTVAAHLPGHGLPDLGKPTLDLVACETAALLGELLETLRPWLARTSSALEPSIVAELDRRVLGPYSAGIHLWWQDEPDRILNWLGVCAGSILTACQSLARCGYERPLARQRALQGLRLFADKGFTPSGECDEGLSYWSYGMSVAALGWSRLDADELAQSVDLERLKQVGDYPRRAHVWGDFFFSGNDAAMHFRADSTLAFWLACATGNSWLAAQHPQGQTLAPSADTGKGGKILFGALLRSLEAHSWPLPDSGAEAAPAQRLDDQQTAIFRASTPRGELLATLSGGDNAERHNHNDLGHINLALNQEWILVDMGAPQGYTADFFGPKRYEYLLASSRGHNCPLIGGHEQRAGKDAAGRVISWEQNHLELDLTKAYPAEAGLKLWTRRLEMQAEGVALFDRFEAAPGAEITLVFWSLFEPRIEAGMVNLGPLVCELRPAPLEWEIEKQSPETLRLRDWRGQTLFGLRLMFRTNERGELSTQTRFLVVTTP